MVHCKFRFKKVKAVNKRERYGLRFVGYEGNEYELIEYDVTSNRATKYKAIKEKMVPSYHPIL